MDKIGQSKDILIRNSVEEKLTKDDGIQVIRLLKEDDKAMHLINHLTFMALLELTIPQACNE